jgi:putative NADH-flavin reductase
MTAAWGVQYGVCNSVRIIVLGATGGTGLQIVEQALKRGHSVTALVRSPERLKAFMGQIEFQQGNLLDSADLQKIIPGHDAVLSAFGPRIPIAKDERHLLEQFGNALTTAMGRTEARRVIVESVAFLFKNSLLPPAYLLGRLLFPSVVKDAAAMEDAFRKSQLDWTMVRPPELTNGPRTGNYRVQEGRLPRFGFSISRADVADCFLNLLESGESVRKIVGVSR